MCFKGEYLGLLGGETTGKCSRAILKKLISKPLRKLINFTGKGGKIAFQALRLYEVLKGAVLIKVKLFNSLSLNTNKNYITKLFLGAVRITRTDAKEAEIQHAVIEWLRNAKKNE